VRLALLSQEGDVPWSTAVPSFPRHTPCSGPRGPSKGVGLGSSGRLGGCLGCQRSCSAAGRGERSPSPPGGAGRQEGPMAESSVGLGRAAQPKHQRPMTLHDRRERRLVPGKREAAEQLGVAAIRRVRRGRQRMQKANHPAPLAHRHAASLAGCPHSSSTAAGTRGTRIRARLDLARSGPTRR